MYYRAMRSNVIRVTADRTRKATAPRTCCETHTDTCKFGRQHTWSVGWYDEAGEWQESAKCFECDGVCVGDL